MTKDQTERPTNFVAEINGHHIYRDDDGKRCHLWTKGVGFWGFDLPEDEARRMCLVVNPAEAVHA